MRTEAAPEAQITGSTRNRTEVFYPIVCCAIILACLFLARPFVESAFDDDWSYSHVAMKLAETGRLHYNGWGSPMILPQVFWAAAWIRLFGFSFDILRFATLPFSLGFVLLVYALGRKTGLGPQLAFFGALTVGTSPLFLPLAATFMTEAYASFFTMLCLYAAIRSGEAEGGSLAARWLWVLAISGIVGGADRQTVWVAPMALLPYLFWIRRHDRRFALHAAVSYAVSIASIALLLAKFTQPYGPLDMPRRELTQLLLHNWPSAFGWMVSALLSCGLVSLPAFFYVAPLWKGLGAARHTASGMMSAASTSFLIAVFTGFGLAPLALAPFVGNMLTRFGILFAGQDLLGFHPNVMPLWLRLGLSWTLGFSAITFGNLCKHKKICAPLPRVPVLVFTIFSCAYLPFFIPGALQSLLYDRYVLPLFPLLVLSIMLPFRSQVRNVPPPAWACLLLFAAYGIATTHDYFAGLRARVLAAQTLERSGIPRSNISAGFEYDGWTQLQLTGRIKGTAYGDPRTLNSAKFWFWRYTTALRPDHVVTYSQSLGTGNGHPSFSFVTWLPPFRRYVTVLRREELPEPSPTP